MKSRHQFSPEPSARRSVANLFLTVLERVRRRYRFVIVGYVVIPEPFIF